MTYFGRLLPELVHRVELASLGTWGLGLISRLCSSGPGRIESGQSSSFLQKPQVSLSCRHLQVNWEALAPLYSNTRDAPVGPGKEIGRAHV